MNVSDSEVVSAILTDNGFVKASTLDEADIILVNTCSIRENAEIRVRGRLKIFNQLKKTNNRILVGDLGCMAERLKEELNLRVWVADDPLTCVVRGTGIVLDNFQNSRRFLVGLERDGSNR